MPSGIPIDWSIYDYLLIEHLPRMTIVEWGKKYAPQFSIKAIGARAKKLGVRPSTYRPDSNHKDKISKAISKETPEIVEFVRKNIDSYSRKELAKRVNLSIARLSELIKRNNIRLSEKGIQRAREASRNGSLGKTPWNKGKTLPEEMKIKMAIGRQRMSGRLSQLQHTFYRILDENNIEYYPENHCKCRFGHWTFDCRIDHAGHDLLVEVQGDYIHSLSKNVSKDRAKATYMERYFPNIPLKYVWEHEFGAANRVKQKVQKWLGLSEIAQEDFEFKDVSIRPIDESMASEFLAVFHYLGKLAGRVRLGAFLGDRLVAVSVWSAPTRSETAIRLGVSVKQCLELRRFVIHDAFHKKNFASWLLAHMENMLPKVPVLVSFADTGVGHTGSIYRATNWVEDGMTSPSFFYVDDDGYVMLKKTLYNQANKMHMKEAEYAETYGYQKVRTPPKVRFVKWKR